MLINTSLSIAMVSIVFIPQINAQNNPLKVIHEKYNNIIKNDSLVISGKISAFAGYKLYDIKKENDFEYQINAMVNFSYRGFDLPLSYNFSNGRSISRVDLPNFRTPKFKTLGASPTYKWAKAHVGNNRSMNFSEYTYQNIRFNGMGLELTPKKFELKAFYGKLTIASQRDLQFQNNLNLEFERKGWGIMTGYNGKETKLHAIVFKAYDKINPDIPRTSISQPKANTTLGIKGRHTLFEKIEVDFDYGLSALTRNSYSDTINILTGSTVYNMLGLYTKTSSSIYRNAFNSAITYNINESNINAKYTKIEKDYRSLGSLMYDNNYTSYTIGYAGPINDKLTIASDVGMRYDGIKTEKNETNKRIVFNSSASYKLNETVSFNSTFSNFQKTSRIYHQNLTTFNYDSISLALVNSNFSISSNIILGEEKKSMLNVMYSMQNSSTIQYDSLYKDNKIKNKLINVAYNKSGEKYNFNSSMTYTINQNKAFSSYSLMPQIKNTYNFSEKLSMRNGLSFNYIYASEKGRKQFLINNGLDFKYNKNNSLNFNMNVNFTDVKERFNLFEIYTDITLNSKF